MDFKLRDSDGRNPFSVSATGDGYFTTQAMRAGYLGDYERPDLVQRQFSETEKWQREIEKEKIRQQIIAEELARKRELEEEVRREMAIERQMALRATADRLPLLPSLSEPRIADRVSLPTVLESRIVERLPFQPRQESRLIERMTLPPMPEARVVERILPQRFVDSAPSEQIASLRSFPEIKKRPTSFMEMPMKLTPAGKKRKEAAGAQEVLWSSTGKKVRIEWKCSVCQVSCTSERGLGDHLSGKKHKAREEELKAMKGLVVTPKNKESAAPLKKANKPETSQKKATQKTKVAPKTGEPKPNKSRKIESGKKKKQLGGDKDPKRFKFWCEHCSVGCNSQIVMSSHCIGKKHKARLEELKNGSGSSDAGTAGTADAEENGKVEDADEAVVVGEAREEDEEENQGPEDGSEEVEQRGEVDQDTLGGESE